MQIDWIHFTPWSALLGGALLGLASGLLALLAGKIAGISGILGGLLSASADMAWRVFFLVGMLLTPLLWLAFKTPAEIQISASTPVIIVAGLLVGTGTRYGSGCTSGHGVCGLSRFSIRSLAAVASFMGAGFITVFLTHHLL
ncbi:YeeE/YedE family protein [Iodobacter sp. LRB]|uniref:YeeE/YedE family protein n=1 Tax=unclassified Iodobacter TaxID=235634 RepID=UPI000C10E147|nr:YeeE/YedE [Iodobacter sp. BJB302]PHV01308.1 YeeE/YedE [Iodobacter sp. BJB302]